MINYETILSNFQDKVTLMQWLKKNEEALKGASLESVSVSQPTATTAILTFHFADGTSLESPSLVLPRGEQGPQGEVGPIDYLDHVDVRYTGNAFELVFVYESGVAQVSDIINLRAGPQGPQGEVGPQGPQGETGATGPQGATGKSIYSLTQKLENINPTMILSKSIFDSENINIGDYFSGVGIVKDADNYKTYRAIAGVITNIVNDNVYVSIESNIAVIRDISWSFKSVLSGTSFNLGLIESNLKRFFSVGFYIEYPTTNEATSVIMYFNRELRSGITRSPIFNLNGTKYYLRLWNDTKLNGYQIELVDAVTDNAIDFSTFKIRVALNILDALTIE